MTKTRPSVRDLGAKVGLCYLGFVDELLKDAIVDLLKNDRISDIVLTEGEHIRYFVGDHLRQGDAAVARRDIESVLMQASVDIASLDSDFFWKIEDRRCRGNLVVSEGRLQVCLRPVAPKLPRFNDCQFPEHSELRRKVVNAENGLLLVCGPTGSGKTRTVGAVINEIAHEKNIHILTFEDPIEYDYPRNLSSLITPRQLESDTTNILQAVRSAARQKPRVIFFSEIRDANMAHAVLYHVTTGHYVISTNHADSATGGIESLLKFFPKEMRDWASYTLSRHLIGVIAQKLVEVNDGGRAAIHEVLMATDAVRHLIKSSADDMNKLGALPNEIQMSGRDGPHISWEMSRHRLVNLGISIAA